MKSLMFAGASAVVMVTSTLALSQSKLPSAAPQSIQGNGDTVMKLSPAGKLLMTLGVRGQRGDWDEAKGQRLLWQPLHLAFAPNGDIYIGEGHANESPNDTDKSSMNKVGAARVLHLDKNGTFIHQWFGNHAGQGHFSMVHGIAINPTNGNVYI